MSLFEVATLLDPYPAYKELRDSEPVHFEPSMNVHVAAALVAYQAILGPRPRLSDEKQP